MAKIKVTAKIDAGVHLKYGPIIKDKQYEIEDTDFGDQLFERPSPGWESPLEKAEREKNVGAPLAAPESAPDPAPDPAPAPDPIISDQGAASGAPAKTRKGE